MDGLSGPGDESFHLPREALFDPGHVVSTPGALAAFVRTGTNPVSLLERHVRGDWGDVPPDDARENELSVRAGFRILSSYPLPTGERMWIITEADRSVTTFLLPSEY